MLVNPNSNQVKLIDFGLAKKYNPNETIQVLCGTPEFIGTSFPFTHLCTFLKILESFRDILYVGRPDLVEEELLKNQYMESKGFKSSKWSISNFMRYFSKLNGFNEILANSSLICHWTFLKSSVFSELQCFSSCSKIQENVRKFREKKLKNHCNL